ncbi:MAG: sensor histidine kinase [Rhodoglobus sp.]
MQFPSSNARAEQAWAAWGDWQDRPHQHKMSARPKLLIPVILSLVVQVPVPLYRSITTAAPEAFLSLVLAVLAAVVLLAARRWPGPVVAVVAALACADFLLSNPGPPYIALAFAVVGAIVRGARAWAWISVGGGWVITVVIAIITSPALHPAGVALTTLGILIVFGIGESMRTRREHFAEFQRRVSERKQTEVQAERVRIARELHDVLAHSLSQINVQAGVGLHLAEKQPEKAREALASIKETSKTALDEVRAVLGVLRAEGGDPSAPLVPEPDLTRLTGLAASVTAQGVDVTLTVSIENAPASTQLAIYRIVQECLTNVIRHAGASRATVDIVEVSGSYVVRVDDDGRGIRDRAVPEDSRGILGMRERAELLGGTLTIGPSPLGGASVIARLPIKETFA